MKLKGFSLQLGTNIFKAFSDEARIRILFQIYKNSKMCISDLEQIFDFTQSKTSRHLSYIKNSGIITFKKHDQWVYYYIKEEYSGIVTQIFSFLEKDPMLLKDYETYKNLYANNELAIRKLHNQQRKYKLPEL